GSSGDSFTTTEVDERADPVWDPLVYQEEVEVESSAWFTGRVWAESVDRMAGKVWVWVRSPGETEVRQTAMTADVDPDTGSFGFDFPSWEAGEVFLTMEYRGSDEVKPGFSEEYRVVYTPKFRPSVEFDLLVVERDAGEEIHIGDTVT